MAKSIRHRAASTLGWVCACAALALACPSPSESPEPAGPPQTEKRSLGDAFEKQAQQERERTRAERTGILAEKALYSVFDEELILRDFFQDRRDGFFVDVGCAWPVAANNTYYLEEHLGWTGIGIDALAEFAVAWKRRRPGSQFFNFLVTDHSGSDEVFYRSEEPGLSSTSERRARGQRFGTALETEEIRVPSITLDQLLQRVGNPTIDLLAMDIEGHELPALRGIDLDRYQPELVMVEGFRRPVIAYLEQHGYAVIERYRRLDRVNTYLSRQPDEDPR
jgi:FkbM family methyltransferase